MNSSSIINPLRKVIQSRLEKDLRGNSSDFFLMKNRDINDGELSRFITKHSLSPTEITILSIALVPHIAPDFYTNLVAEYLPNGGEFPEFGGVKGKNHRGILPTGETVLYILAGKDMEKRIEISKRFDQDHLFARKNVLYLENPGVGEPRMSGRLVLDEDFVELFTKGSVSKPKLSSDFPAELIETELEWRDLVLKEKTLEEIREVETWLEFNETLMNDWNMSGKIKPGYTVLFHGPPGTGKTMTACLLGKYTRRDVFRIDLSTVVSKYIGETEKNLSRLFDKARNKEWILFFDEADSIFGKRTNVRDAHDKYANQEVSYLLQRIEFHPGLVILASNMKSNIDSAFTRRFNSIIEFEKPGVQERLRLWKNYLPEAARLAEDIWLDEVARKYDLTGANIVNAIQYSSLQTLRKKLNTINKEDFIKGIKKEYEKEGKMMRQES